MRAPRGWGHVFAEPPGNDHARVRARCREMHRVLKPGGKAIMSFSNRCFPTKAIAVWTSTGDLDHVYIVGAYFHYSVPGGFTAPVAHDITLPKSRKGAGDPMYVVEACKVA